MIVLIGGNGIVRYLLLLRLTRYKEGVGRVCIGNIEEVRFIGFENFLER